MGAERIHPEVNGSENFQQYKLPDMSYPYTDIHDACRTQVRNLSSDYKNLINPLQQIMPLSERVKSINSAIPALSTEAFVKSYVDLMREKKQANQAYFEEDIERHTPFYYAQLQGNDKTIPTFDWSGVHDYAQGRERRAHALVGESEDTPYSLGHHLLRGLNSFTYSFTTSGIEKIMKQDGGWEFTKGYLEAIFEEKLPDFPITFDPTKTNSRIETSDINNISIIIGTSRQVASAQALIILVEEVFEASLTWKLNQSGKWDTNNVTKSVTSQGVKELLSGFVIDTLITSNYLEQIANLPAEEVAVIRKKYQQEYLANMVCFHLVNGVWETEVARAFLGNNNPDAKPMNEFMTASYMQWKKKVWTPNLYASTPDMQDKTWATMGGPLVHESRFPLFLPVYTTRFLATVCEPPTQEKIHNILTLVQEEGPNTTVEQCIFPSDEKKQRELTSQNGISREWMNKLNNFLKPVE